MFLPSVSNFYTWTTVSVIAAGHEIKVHFQDSASASVSGLGSILLPDAAEPHTASSVFRRCDQDVF